ncbi:hypothetical protein [Anatilimnocola floriformis]|uniref:hypothetical protein n=1 Tax=Anatilimnocola floriformis TaxID=2948575 RepID=UPI0020C20191|nr:hypothetical protein [Anatilimnocola floriformis]
MRSTPASLEVRSPWRISLRAMLIVLLVLAVPLAWVSHWRRGKLREHAAAKQLRKLGFEVKMRRPELSQSGKEPWYASLLPPDHLNEVMWVQAPRHVQLDAESIGLLCELPNLVRLDLSSDNFRLDILGGDADLSGLRSLAQLEILSLDCRPRQLAYFANQHSLKELWLMGPRIDDDCRQLLHNNPRLTHVSLGLTQTSDALAPELARLHQLEFLQLLDAHVTSQGVAQLSELRNLQQLLLVGAEINDTAVPAILRLQTLRFLAVRSTGISDAGREQLQRGLPNCKFD